MPLARQAEQHQISTAEALERQEEAQAAHLSRRALLRAGAVGAASLALNGATPALASGARPAGAPVAIYRVGQWTRIGGAEGEAVGQLHFCGEHTSSEAQGYMEGGVESGEWVARELRLSRRAQGVSGRFAWA
ncbi:hypothetical protein GCM10022631_27230 [Deinococcus rubellus]